MHSVGVRTTTLVVLIYVAAVYVGRQTVLEGTGLAMFWPAAGIAALWMLRGRSWSQVRLDAGLLFLSTFLVNLALSVPADAAIFFSLANLVQGFVVRVLVAHLQRVPLGGRVAVDLASLRALTHLITASVVSAVASSPIGMIAAYLVSGTLSGEIQAAWVVRNACGTFVVAAAFLALGSCIRARAAGIPGRSMLTGERRPHAVAELVLATLTTSVLVVSVFGPTRELPLTYAMIAGSVWFGFRFSPAVATLHSLGLGVLVVVFTLQGWGPFGALPDRAVQAMVAQLFVAVTTMIVLLLSLGVAERQALAARIRASESRATARADLLTAVTTAMSEGVLLITADGEVTMSNPAAAAFAVGDVDPQQQVLRDFRAVDGTVLTLDDLPHVRTLRGEDGPPVDLVHVDPVTGGNRVFSVTSAPVPSAGVQHKPAAVLVVRDVTRDRGRERELQAYAGVVAHDLRSPLGALKSWAEILDEQLDDLGVDVTTPKASLIRIYTTADRMQELIADLLNYAQAQSAEIDPEVLDLEHQVDEIGGELVAASSTGVASGRPGPAPLFEHDHLDRVRADPTLTRQLLANLLGNAVKYVAAGTRPVVRVSSRRVDSQVEIRVSDNGIGIPDDARGRVFESFYRAAGREYAGTGLGLAICAKTVERHGGRIYATEGPDGRGTTMVFTLPAVESDAADPADGTTDAGAGPAQREERTTSAEPPPRRTGSEAAVR